MTRPTVLRLLVVFAGAAVGFWLLERANALGDGGAGLGLVAGLAGLALLALAAAGFAVASLLSERLAELVAALIHPPRRRAHGRFDQVESLVTAGDYEAALAELKRLALTRRDDAAPYVRMMEIALRHLGDRERADALRQRGMALLDRPARRKLEEAWEFLDS